MNFLEYVGAGTVGLLIGIADLWTVGVIDFGVVVTVEEDDDAR